MIYIGGYKSINQFIVNGGRYTQMRTMVLEYIYQHLPQKWPSFVGKNTISPWFASGNGVRSAGRWVFLQCPGSFTWNEDVAFYGHGIS